MITQIEFTLSLLFNPFTPSPPSCPLNPSPPLVMILNAPRISWATTCTKCYQNKNVQTKLRSSLKLSSKVHNIRRLQFVLFYDVWHWPSVSSRALRHLYWVSSLCFNVAEFTIRLFNRKRLLELSGLIVVTLLCSPWFNSRYTALVFLYFQWLGLVASEIFLAFPRICSRSWSCDSSRKKETV